MRFTQHTFILLPILICLICGCEQKSPNIQKWHELNLVDKNKKLYTINTNSSNTIAITDSKILQATGHSLPEGVSGSFTIVSIDSIETNNDSLLYKINLENDMYYKVFLSDMANSQEILRWVLFNGEKMVWQLYMASTKSLEYFDLDEAIVYDKRIDDKRWLYPIVEVDGKSWIAPGYEKENIHIDNNLRISLGEESEYHQINVSDVGDNHWAWRFNGWESYLRMSKTNDQGEMYIIEISPKDSTRYPFSSKKFIEISPELHEKLSNATSHNLGLNGIKLLPIVYTEHDMQYVHQNYIREADTLANEVNSIKGYIKYKYPDISQKATYNIKKEVKTNGGIMVGHHFLLYETDPDIHRIKYDVENSETKEIETVAEWVETKRYRLFIFRYHDDGRIFLVHEARLRNKITAFSIGGSDNSDDRAMPFFFHSNPKDAEEANYLKGGENNIGKTYGRIHISFADHEGNTEKYTFDTAYDWDHIKHSRSVAATQNSYTWILHQLTRNGKAVILPNYIIDIKNFDEYQQFAIGNID